jgi:hypothetical protein
MHGVKDGIICHNGEKDEQYLLPDNNVKNLDDVKIEMSLRLYEGL